MKKIIFGLATLSLLTISSMANEKQMPIKGVDLGNAKACTNLGYMYGTGKGVQKYITVNYIGKAVMVVMLGVAPILEIY